MVVLRAEVQVSLFVQAGIVVSRAEQIHPPVEDVRLRIGDEEPPGRRQDGILALVSYRDETAHLVARLRTEGGDDGVSFAASPDNAFPVDAGDPFVAGLPADAAGNVPCDIQLHFPSAVDHGGNTVQFPGCSPERNHRQEQEEEDR